MDYLDATYLSSEANREIGRGVRFDVDQSGKVFEVANEPEALPMEVTAGEQESKSLAEFAKSGLDVYAGGLKGLAQAWVGIGGDLERLVTGLRDAAMAGPSESAWDAFLMGLGKDSTLLWDTNEAKAILDKYLPYQPITEAGAAKVPGEDGRYMSEGMGEFFAPGGQLKTGLQVIRGIRKGLDMLPPSMQPGPMSAGLSVKPVTEAEAAQMLAAKGVQQPAKQQAPKSGLGFYSAVEDAALNLQRNSGAGQAFLNDIKKGANVKDEEIKWIGLDEFLAGKKNVTKQEVQDYIANNRVDVQEVALGGGGPFDSKRLDELLSEYNSLKQHPIDDPSFGQEKYDELIRLMNIRDQSTTDTLYQQAEEFQRMAQRAQRQGNTLVAEKYFREAEFFNTRAEKLDLEGLGMDSPPKFGQYTLPGGENYREILLTMPFKEPAMPKGYEVTSVQYDDGTFRYFANTPTTRSAAYKTEADAMNELQRKATALKGFRENQQAYRSGHWDEPNVLAHLRVNDRVDADGKKMLLIEEVQSDWHQAGRDKGYASDVGPKVSDAEYKRGVELQQRDVRGESLTDAERQEMQDILRRHDASVPGTKVPDAPMKDTWYQLALKRALQYAAENGYDRVGLTTGSRQAERYDLSKQISRVVYNPETEMLNAFDKSNVSVIQRSNVKPNEVQDYIGKEPAQRLFDEQNAKTDRRGGKDVTYQEISGEDLQVGGEGMKKYYDEVYPKFLQKYGKKWGANVGETTVNIATEDKMVSKLREQGYDPETVTLQTILSDNNGRTPSWLTESDVLMLELGVELTTKGIQREPIRYIDITPKMKQSVSESGQPLFTAAPIATGAGSATIAQDGETDGN